MRQHKIQKRIFGGPEKTDFGMKYRYFSWSIQSFRR